MKELKTIERPMQIAAGPGGRMRGNHQRAGIPLRSRGQQRFSALPLSLNDHCRNLNASNKAVSQWRNGSVNPNPEYRARIEAEYGIGINEWEMQPVADLSELDAKEPESEPVENDAPEVAGTPLEQCKSRLAKIRKALNASKLTTSELTKLSDAEGKLIALQARLERDEQLSEDRFVREHPAWLRLRKLLVHVLSKHPAALREVQEALARLEL